MVFQCDIHELQRASQIAAYSSTIPTYASVAHVVDTTRKLNTLVHMTSQALQPFFYVHIGRNEAILMYLSA